MEFDIDISGIYVWSSHHLDSYASWATDEPSDRTHSENCMSLKLSEGGEYAYSDTECGQKQKFMCMKGKSNI